MSAQVNNLRAVTGDQQVFNKYAISKEVMERVIVFLTHQPYKDVAGLLAAIQKDAKEINETVQQEVKPEPATVTTAI